MFLWFKALHIIALVCWFAALFYLPRLFVYHADADDAPSRQRFVVMEARLLRIIAHPAAAASLISGLLLAAQAWDWYSREPWFWFKMALVAILLAYHALLAAHHRRFAGGTNTFSSRYFRWFNELPTVILITAVVLAVVKPF